MKNFLILFTISSISLIYSQESYQCNVYKCASNNLKSSQCIYSHLMPTNTTLYEISLTCPSGTYCPAIFDSQNQTCVTLSAPKGLVEGEICSNNTNCASNICNSPKCQGLAANAVCTDHAQCGIGYSCASSSNNTEVKNCKLQGKLGESCDSDYDCQNNLGCYHKNKTCVQYLSLLDGSQVNDFEDMLCQNMKAVKGHCVSTKLLQDSDECTAINGTLQQKCEYNATGLPSGNETTFKTNCQCSKAFANKNFCEYDTINPNWQKYISKLVEYFNNHAQGKHTKKRFEYDSDLNKMSLTVGQYPQYKDADSCIINLELSSGWIKNSFISLLFFALALLI
jgi:hypothetical protein